MRRISEFYHNMTMLSRDGLYLGRVWEVSSQTLSYLHPEQGVLTLPLADAEEMCERGLWMHDEADPAVQQCWREAKDIPASRPGLTFADGKRVGESQVAAMSDFTGPPDPILYEKMEPVVPSSDDFNDGYRTGYSEAFNRRFWQRRDEPDGA